MVVTCKKSVARKFDYVALNPTNPKSTQYDGNSSSTTDYHFLFCCVSIFWHRTSSGNPTMVKARCLCAQKVFELVICRCQSPFGSDGGRYRSWERPSHMSRFWWWWGAVGWNLDQNAEWIELMEWRIKSILLQMKMVGTSCRGNPNERIGNELIIATSVTKDHRECNDGEVESVRPQRRLLVGTNPNNEWNKQQSHRRWKQRNV